MIRRFEIRHLRRGLLGKEHQALVAPTLIFPTIDGARREFDRYCDAHLGPHEVADLLDEKGRVIGSRRGRD